MSLPRDLKVQIPGHGTDKINAAYELGGPRLTLKTVKQLTGLRDQPRDQRRLPRLLRRASTRSAASTSTSTAATSTTRAELRVHQRPARLPEDVRPQGAPVRALPPRGQRPRALRPPAGLPAPGQAAGRRRQADRQARQAGARSSASYTTSDIRCARSEVLRLLKLAVFSVGQPIREIHFEGQLDPRAASPNMPSYVTRRTRRSRSWSSEFLGVRTRPARAAADSQRQSRAPRAATPGSRTPTSARQGPGGAGGPGGRRRQPARLLPDGLRTPGSLYAGPPRVYKIARPGRQALRRLPDGAQARPRSASTTAFRAPPGRTRRSSRTPPRRARSAAASSSSTTTATACGSWPGAPARPSTGSRTRCCSRSPSSQMLAIARSAQARCSIRLSSVLAAWQTRNPSESSASAGSGLVTGGLLRRARPRGLRARHRARRRSSRCAAARCRSTSPACPSWCRRTPSGCTSRPTWATVLENAQLLFCCVDTPPTYSGDADLSRVDAVVEELGELERPRAGDEEHGAGRAPAARSSAGANGARLRVEPGVPEGGHARSTTS